MFLKLPFEWYVTLQRTAVLKIHIKRATLREQNHQLKRMVQQFTYFHCVTEFYIECLN